MRSKILTRNLIVMITVIVLILLWTAQVWAQDGDGADVLLEGAQLYRQYCVACHGEQGAGREGISPALIQQPVIPEVDLETVIRNGVPGTQMIAWSQDNDGPLSDDQINALMMLILSWSDDFNSEFELTPTVTVTPYPVPLDLQGSSTGIVVGAFVVVLIVIIGVITIYKRS